jgi:hypothetical protein
VNSAISFDTLNTSYVSLSALIRYLREQGVSGRLHVALKDYESDVILNGSQEPQVFERDFSSGREAQGTGAFERLLVRAREPGGLITFYKPEVAAATAEEKQPPAVSVPQTQVTAKGTAQKPESHNLLELSGDLIAAVERAVVGAGANFNEEFQQACLEVGDDYSFLDPTLQGFDYADSTVTVTARPSRPVFIAGLTECLRKLVNRVAERKPGFRERVAAELSLAAKQRANGLAEFNSQFDRITGMMPPPSEH